PAAGRQLRRLHRLAVRTAQSQWRPLGEVEAAHGLEQQVIEALAECVAAGPSATETLAGRRQRCLLIRFDTLIEAGRFRDLAAIYAALGASERQLRQASTLHLGMGPGVYRQRRAMQQVHRALRSSDPDATTVSDIAQRHGFRALGRFAGNYRGVYGELPSATLRRELLPAVPDLTLGRPRLMTFS
ncbi:MAG: helix-turn-helix domain-containing protein, partial [Stellaceae bacterium]